MVIITDILLIDYNWKHILMNETVNVIGLIFHYCSSNAVSDGYLSDCRREYA